MTILNSGRTRPRRALRRLPRFLSIRSAGHFYASLVAGIAVALLPTEGVQGALLMILALVVRLNIAVLSLGALLIMALPITHLLAYWLAERLGPDLPTFSGDYLRPEWVLANSSTGVPYLLGCVGVTLGIAALLIPVVRLSHRTHERLAGPRIGDQVFRDPSGWRTHLVGNLGRAAFFVGAALGLTFLVAVAALPTLPSLALTDPNPYGAIAPAEAEALTDPYPATPPDTDPATAAGPFDPSSRPGAVGKVLAFYVPWDPNSEISLRRNIDSIDVVVPEWFHLERDLAISDARQPHVDDFLADSRVSVTPSISNLIDQSWDREAVAELMNSPAKTERFITQLLELLSGGPYRGINLDFENLLPADRVGYRTFVEHLATRLHTAGFTLSIDLSAGQPEIYDYPGLAAAADYIVVMVYDEHYSTGEPGPVASQPWFEDQLSSLAGLPADRVVVGLGNYGYDWVEGGEVAPSLAVPDALEIARMGGLEIVWDTDQANPHYAYRDEAGVHQVWFLDAATTHNQVRQAITAGFHNVGLWVLGSEDPGVWAVFDTGPGSPGTLERLEVVENAPAVRHIGTGAILGVASTPVDGSRDLTFHNGLVADEV